MKRNSCWIWNYGDYEIYHANLANSRRQEYGADYPVFRKYYDVDRNVKFVSEIEADNDGYLIIHLCGVGCISVDGEKHASGKAISIPKGRHSLSICVCSVSGLPAAFIESDVCATGEGWYTVDNGVYSCGERKHRSVTTVVRQSGKDAGAFYIQPRTNKSAENGSKKTVVYFMISGASCSDF